MIFGVSTFGTPFDLPPATTEYKTYSFDAIMAMVPEVPYAADALAEASCITEYGADARLEANPVHTHRADGIIELGILESYEADALAEASLLKTYSMSGRIKIDIHEFFYVADAALMKCNVRASYRMGGTISDVKYSPTAPQQTAFSAKQSLIVPEDINADDRFKYARRRG